MAIQQILGRKIDGYRIDEEIGRGGMARVFRAYDMGLNRYAAVKVIDPRNEPEDYGEYRSRFKHEAQTIAQLRHQHIVAVYRFGDIDNHLPYIAMEYIDGATLRWVIHDYYRDNQFIPHESVLSIVKQIGGALDYAHARGVIHRDVKPSNIMLNRQKEAILTDFGLALMASKGTEGESFGSPHYIAPEQAMSSANVVPQSDLYSLGITLYEMLTGRVPFDDGAAVQIAMAHMVEEPPDPREFNPHLHESLVDVLNIALQKAPDDRFQSGDKMYKALRSALRDAKRAGMEISAKPRSIHSRGRKKATLKELPVDVTIKIEKYREEHHLPSIKRVQGKTPGSRRLVASFLILALVLTAGSILLFDLGNMSSASMTSATSTATNFALEGVVRGVDGSTLLIFDQAITLPADVLVGNLPESGATVRIVGSTSQVDKQSITLADVQSITVNGTPIYPPTND